MSRLRKSAKSYSLSLAAGATSPVDAATYYIGSTFSKGFDTTNGIARVYIPKSGVIRAASLFFAQTPGSAETSSAYIRVNDQNDYLISNSIVNNSAATTASNTALNIAVSAGDFIEVKWITPTWATNPTSVRPAANIFVQ